ncbi:dethiobiotin synthase [bacterium]|nr:dethiobiotin synthase [bacterium]
MEYFITGIDTDIGKTYVTRGIAIAFEKEGRRTGVYKPLQSGAIKSENGFLAPDLEAVKRLSSTINTKCSYLLEGEVSPALAARLAGVRVDINKIKSDFKEFSSLNEVTLVEGAGGILAPAVDNMLCADLIKELNIPVIIVTVPFLGRLNHTLLTIFYAKKNNIPIKGLVINKIPNSTEDLATINFIKELTMYTDVPIIGKIHESDTNNISEFSELINKL